MEKLEKLESPESVVSWYREQELLAWRDIEKNDSSNSTFSINENEFPLMPLTLQEIMIQSFETEKEGNNIVVVDFVLLCTILLQVY